MSRWVDYWRAVSGRITWDRSLLRGAWTVPWLHWRGRRGRPAQRGTIAYWPQPGAPWYTMPLALCSTSLRETRDLRAADAVMIFDDRTETTVALPDTDARLLNARATDISKSHVGDVFETVFGYPVTVDPVRHAGVMVEKSEENGVHDGRIVQGPLTAPRPGCLYQRLADSTVRDGVTEDLRCICVGGRLVLVFRKEKAAAARFGTAYLGTTVREAQDCFSTEELSKIARFCDGIGLDFGSVDVVRDYPDAGRPYIVDVNKTCMPVLSMPVGALEPALRRIGTALEALVLSPR
ncbi:hypothetical protein [uncultured Algimonas sp.]|uniref:hypothetical protein n=1 Tax=uncultured Algimonas sp. TaxID=1547920 RepID=UPI002637E18B|nr:hypothetical protein [uncultured Algimonas sp.]